MNFHQLADQLAIIETQNSRLNMAESLAKVWRQLDRDGVYPTANLIQGQLQPAYDSLEFSLSEKMVARALGRLILSHGGLPGSGIGQDLFGDSDEQSLLEQVKAVYKTHGDWGKTAQDLSEQLEITSTNQTITHIYQQLVAIARVAGEGSQEGKLELLTNLLSQVSGVEAKYLVRIIIGKLRLGFSLVTILDSLSWAGTGDKRESKTLEELYQKKADLGLLAQSYLQWLSLTSEERLAKLQAHYQLAFGVPVVPALCQRLNSSGEIIEKMSEVIAEPKYDGMRVQIHLQKTAGEVKIMAFTRSLENVSEMFPELKQIVAELPIQEAIFDSETVAFSPTSNKILPFQDMMTRRRKHQIDKASMAVPLKFFIFDVLHLDGKSLLDTPLLQRKQILARLITETSTMSNPPYLITSDPDELKTYHQRQLALGLEGVVVKGVNSLYQSGRKGWNWVKIKEEEGTRGKLRDTLDLVVLGLYAGRGKRHDFGVGAFLVGLPNDQGELLTLSKIGTGLTDDDFRQLKSRSEKLISANPPANLKYPKNLTPDTWLVPELVVEIAADELTKSSVHTSGYGLRFPRLIRWRDDKTAEQATSLKELASLS